MGQFEFFVFLVFMSIISFAVAFLAYAMVVRCMGKEGTASRMAQVLLVPACVIIFDFIVFAAPLEYRYVVGSLPLLIIAGLLLYVRFFKGESLYMDAPSPAEMAQRVAAEPKKQSKKSARIHERRQRRGGR